MTDRAPFPDVEVVVVDVLADLADGGTTTPADLQSAMPFIRVQRFGGPDDGFTDTAAVSIDAFGSSRSAALALAEAIRQRLTSGPNTVAAGTIDRVTTSTGPNEVPWQNDQNVRRFTASYSVAVRR